MTRTVAPLRLRLVAAAGVLVAALALHAGTSAPTVGLVDAGELTVAASNFGVAHPPGFPVYTLVANLASRLPFGTVAKRVNLASAAFGALAAATITLAVFEAAATRRRRPRPGRRTPPAPRFGPVAAGAVGAGLAFACSRTLWSYATVAEVYTLNTTLVALALLALLAWRRRGGALLLAAAAAAVGLGLGVHHVSVALAVPAFAVFVVRTKGAGFLRRPELWIAAAAGVVAVAAAYATLPLAASRPPLLAWGDPTTPKRLWWHVTGRQYQSYLAFSADRFAHEALRFVRFLGREWGPAWVPLVPAAAVAGIVRLFRRDRTLAWTLVILAAVNVVYALPYEIAEDKDAYLLPLYTVVAVLAGVGAAWPVAAMASRRAAAAAVAAVLVLPAPALAYGWPYANRSGYTVARDHVSNAMATVAPGGLLLTADWQLYSPAFYLHEAEGFRRDAIIVDVNLLRRTWYFDYLERRYPQLVARSRAEVRDFLADLRAWEADPGRYDRDPALNKRINDRFTAMIVSFVERHPKPVAVAYDIGLNLGGDQATLVGELSRSRFLVPRGLVFELGPQGEFREPAAPPFRLGWADRMRFERDDPVRQKVMPAYVLMLDATARYLSANGFTDRAERVAAEARALERRFG